MKLKFFTALAILGTMGLFTGCTPDENGDGNGTTVGDIDASFTVAPKDGSANRFILTAASNKGTLTHIWNAGSGDVRSASSSYELFLPDAGTYTISHTMVGVGGATVTSEQTVTVATPDPVAGNLIRGGKFDTLADYNEFDILTISAGGTAWSYDATNKRATVQGGGWNQQGIYQAVEVVGGKTYEVNMRVTGSGSINTWFELYVSQTAPTQGNDYSADGKRMQINTWAGCGGSPYDGLFSAVQCAANETSGRFVTFPNSGTAYVVVKCGGENIGSVSIDNVEMRRTN
ncbi:MAG TPA: hypothetical protein VK183_00455 [Flavobacterium sp.]|nr:hypothetical protein [Flavobacterium sp.]